MSMTSEMTRIGTEFESAQAARLASVAAINRRCNVIFRRAARRVHAQWQRSIDRPGAT